MKKCFFTICCPKDIHKAIVCCNTFRKFNPDYECKIFTIGNTPKLEQEELEVINVYHNNWMFIKDMTMWYNQEEICIASVPFVANYLLDNNYSIVAFAHYGFYFVGGISFLENMAGKYSLVLFPYLNQYYSSINDYNTFHNMPKGLFNLNFILFSKRSINVIEYLKERFYISSHMPSLDYMQLVLDKTITLFDSICVVKNYAIPISYYNIRENPIQEIDKKIKTKLGQVYAFDFSRVHDIGLFELLSSHNINNNDLLIDVFDKYNESISSLNQKRYNLYEPECIDDIIIPIDVINSISKWMLSQDIDPNYIIKKGHNEFIKFISSNMMLYHNRNSNLLYTHLLITNQVSPQVFRGPLNYTNRNLIHWITENKLIGNIEKFVEIEKSSRKPDAIIEIFNNSITKNILTHVNPFQDIDSFIEFADFVEDEFSVKYRAILEKYFYELPGILRYFLTIYTTNGFNKDHALYVLRNSHIGHGFELYHIDILEVFMKYNYNTIEEMINYYQKI